MMGVGKSFSQRIGETDVLWGNETELLLHIAHKNHVTWTIENTFRLLESTGKYLYILRARKGSLNMIQKS